MMKSRGFTLIEIIIALAIFAILGVLIAFGLRSVTQTQHQLSQHSQEWQKIAITNTLIRRDISQIVPVDATDEYGKNMPALLSGNDNSITLTRTGWQNSNATFARSDLIRVQYAVKNNQLYRISWRHIKPNADNKPTRQSLLSNVTTMQVLYFYHHGQFSHSWPISHGGNANTGALPEMAAIYLTLQNDGVLKIEVPLATGGDSQ